MSSSAVGRSSQESKHGDSDGAHVETRGRVAGSGCADKAPPHKLSELQQQQWPEPVFTPGDINPQLPPRWYLLTQVPLDNMMIVRLIVRARSAHKPKVFFIRNTCGSASSCNYPISQSCAAHEIMQIWVKSAGSSSYQTCEWKQNTISTLWTVTCLWLADGPPSCAERSL